MRLIDPALHAELLRQIPLRFLNTEDHAPAGRPIRFSDLGRPLTQAEFYKIRKWRKSGVPEMKIKRLIVEAGKERDALNALALGIRDGTD